MQHHCIRHCINFLITSLILRLKPLLLQALQSQSKVQCTHTEKMENIWCPHCNKKTTMTHDFVVGNASCGLCEFVVDYHLLDGRSDRETAAESAVLLERDGSRRPKNLLTFHGLSTAPPPTTDGHDTGTGQSYFVTWLLETITFSFMEVYNLW